MAAILSLLTLCNAWASYRITGEVKDKKSGEPVAGAFVLAYSDNTQKGFAYSGADGSFAINIQDDVTINTIKVTMMGYAAASISTNGRTSDIIIALEEQAMKIQPASVKSGPIRRVGDTLSFYVQAFTDGSEQVLGDLINKIPGLTTTESGTILHEGEAINKFYVENLDLMGGRYGVVTNNLKAGDVARVDVYLNHQPINALKDLDPSERSAVNIVLKEDARGSWIFTGDILAGLPPFPLFNAKAMFTRFGKKNQDLYLLKGNNLGADIIRELMEQPGTSSTPRAYLITGGLDNQLSTPLNPSTSTLPIPKEYWYDNISGIATFNHLAKTGSHSQLRLNINAAAERYNEASSSSETITFDDGTTMTIDDHKSLTDRKNYFQGQVTYEENSTARFLSEAFSLSGQFRDNTSNGEGRYIYGQQYDLPSFKANNDLRLTLRKGRRAININSTITFLHNAHSATYETGGNTYDQSYLQNDLVTSHSTGMSLSTGRHKIDINASLGMDYISRKSELSGMATLSEPLHDQLSITTINPNLSLKDDINIGNLRIIAALPAIFHVLLINGRDNIIYPDLSPSLSIHHNISTKLETNIRAGYSITRSAPQSLLNAVIMKNYRTISRPDSLNRNARFNAYAGIRYSDPIGMLFMNLNGSYSRQRRDNTASNQYLDDFTLSKNIPLPVTTYSYSANGSVRKYFGVKTLMLEVTAGYDHSNMEEYLQQTLVGYTTRSIKTGATIRTNPANWISLTIKGEYTRQMTESRLSNVTSHILTGEGNLRITPYKKLDFDLEGYMRRERIPGVTVYNRPLLKSTLSWRLSKGTAYIQCRNLLDIDEYRRETITSYRTISSSTRLRGRQFLLGLRMSF